MAGVKVNVEGKSVLDLLKEGNRAYLVGNYSTAVACLSRCAEKAVAEHGEQDESLGQIYFSYGRALLELSREDGDLLGEAVPKDVPLEAVEEDLDEDDAGEEDEEMEGEEEEEEAEDEEEGDTAESGENAKQAEPEEAKSNGSKKGEEVLGSSAKGIDSNGGAGGKEEGKDTEMDVSVDDGAKAVDAKAGESSSEQKEEEPSDLQVAWEVLELAKIIFQQKGDAGKERLASTLILLGEVSLESENFESAVNDIKQGLELQKAIFGPDSRKLAETYYKLGMALSTNSQMEEAVENFAKSIEHLNNRIAKLEESQLASDKQEVQEMRKLIPEIEEKIADVKVYKEEASNPVAPEAEPEPAIQPSPEKKAMDISHLVKRKRNLNDSREGGHSSPAKKPAMDS